MRKYHKKQILDLLKTLDKIVGKMKELLMNKQFPTLINMLADCQDGAVNISEFIKEVHSEGTKTEQLLAGFSETLYKASVELSPDLIEHLKKQIAAIEASVNIELKPNKIEAVFLPYKASMWDSLESIYLAARSDPACDAYVIPIPYYDKKNGKFTEMHWETNYPKDIPVVDYRKYNIEERHPDIIFIHNPYDNCNIVTSVHPDFYSNRLRNLTDCLVYVPYFVLSGKEMTGQEHFCTLPACVFAHKVVVQTEEERKIYVREYSKVARDYENKFLPLGSPKLDKAVSAKREDYGIPAEWEKLISNADGTRKKVVFYNTSIGALLQYSVEDNKPSNKYLQKMRSVFEFFKARNDVVLLWRPHPLLEGTIKSMRPWLEREYAEIVDEYKRGKYGIYDGSEDLNRAVALSDMYYGDGSSVTQLFKAAGKGVLGQLFTPPTTYGLYDDGNFVWFMNYLNIYKYNKQSEKTEYMGIVPAENGLSMANINITENKGKLYFAPFYKNNKIFIFDKGKKNFKRIDYRNYSEFDYKFNNIISFENFIYFIPFMIPAIMRLNVDTNELEYLSQWVNAVSKSQTMRIQEDTWKNIIFWGSCIIGSEIALTINASNSVMFFNAETGNCEIKNIGEKVGQYFEICFDGQNYYLSLFYENYIVKWNRQTNETSKITFPSSFSRKINKNFNFIMRYFNGYVWLFPYVANNAYKININTGEINELPELVECFENKNLSCYYSTVFANGNFIYASTLNKGIVEYNINTRELNFIDDFMKDEDMNALVNCLNQDSQDLRIDRISSNWSLSQFLT